MSLIEHLGAKFSEILIEIYIFSFKKMHLKLSVAILSQPQCVKVLKIVAKRCYKWCSCGLCFESNGTWGQSRGRHTHHVVTKILGMTVIKVSFVSSPWLRFLILESMMTSSNANIFRVTGPLCGEFTSPGEFPSQRPVTRSFDVFFDQRTYKRLSKQPWDWWFETQSWSLWRQCNGKAVCQIIWIVITFDRYNHITLRGDLSSDNTLSIHCDPIWRHGPGSIWAQVMAYCLMAPSHYLNQCWLTEGNVTRYTSAINQLTWQLLFFNFIQISQRPMN